MASRTDRVMKPSQWEQLGLTLRREKRSRRRGNPRGGLDVREILPRPAKGGICLLTSPSIGHSHRHDDNEDGLNPQNRPVKRYAFWGQGHSSWCGRGWGALLGSRLSL